MQALRNGLLSDEVLPLGRIISKTIDDSPAGEPIQQKIHVLEGFLGPCANRIHMKTRWFYMILFHNANFPCRSILRFTPVRVWGLAAFQMGADTN